MQAGGVEIAFRPYNHCLTYVGDNRGSKCVVTTGHVVDYLILYGTLPSFLQ